MFGKIFKANFVITMFLFNNTPNDFTLIFCFIACTYCGMHYNRYYKVFCKFKFTDMNKCCNNRARAVALEQKLRRFMATEYEGKAFKVLAGVTIFQFFMLLGLAMF